MAMHEENHDLVVLEEGEEAGVVQACCKGGTSSKL
jgi:hypothetical protein